MPETRCPNCDFADKLNDDFRGMHTCDHCSEVYDTGPIPTRPRSEPLNPYAAPSVDACPSDPNVLVEPTGSERRALFGDGSVARLVDWLPSPFGNRPPIKNRYLMGGSPFAAVWFGYRRMPRQAMLCYARAFGMALLYSVAFFLLEFLTGGNGNSARSGFAIGFGVGLCADRPQIYTRHMNNIIRSARRMADPDSEHYIQLLRKRGGTSLFAGVVHLSLYITIVFVVQYVFIAARYIR